MTRGRPMAARLRLTERARRWIDGIKGQYRAQLLGPAADAPGLSDPAFKIL
mgnify:FL=1